MQDRKRHFPDRMCARTARSRVRLIVKHNGRAFIKRRAPSVGARTGVREKYQNVRSESCLSLLKDIIHR